MQKVDSYMIREAEPKDGNIIENLFLKIGCSPKRQK